VLYFKQFSFLEVQADYSEEGKSKTDLIIATIIKAKDEILNHINLKTYADVAEEVRTIFNTKPVERGSEIARKIARGALKYGLVHAYAGAELLNKFNKEEIEKIVKQIDYSSMLIVIQG
jgi:hypothetical protein